MSCNTSSEMRGEGADTLERFFRRLSTGKHDHWLRLRLRLVTSQGPPYPSRYWILVSYGTLGIAAPRKFVPFAPQPSVKLRKKSA